MELLTINISELILTIFNFFLLMFLLKRFLYTPILTFMDARSARIAAGMEQEKAAQAAIEEQVRQHDDQRHASQEAAKQLLVRAKTEREQAYAQLLTQTREEFARCQKETQAEAQKQHEADRQLLNGQRDVLAARLAQQLLGNERLIKE